MFAPLPEKRLPRDDSHRDFPIGGSRGWHCHAHDMVDTSPVGSTNQLIYHGTSEGHDDSRDSISRCRRLGYYLGNYQPEGMHLVHPYKYYVVHQC